MTGRKGEPSHRGPTSRKKRSKWIVMLSEEEKSQLRTIAEEGEFASQADWVRSMIAREYGKRK